MSTTARKGRDRAEREQRIITAARNIAERDGWDAVTIRRLAHEIEYSQPVLYAHFANRDAIVTAVALEGFQALTIALRDAACNAAGPTEALHNVALAYLAFALTQPALYAAMFILPTDLRFATADTSPQLRAGFDALAAVAAPFCRDVELVTESFWAALHGLAELDRTGRTRPGRCGERVTFIVQAIIQSGTNTPRAELR